MFLRNILANGSRAVRASPIIRTAASEASKSSADATNNVLQRAMVAGTMLAAANKVATKVGFEGTTKRYILVFASGVVVGQLFGIDGTDLDGWKKNPIGKIQQIFDVSTSPLPEKVEENGEAKKIVANQPNETVAKNGDRDVYEGTLFGMNYRLEMSDNVIKFDMKEK